MIRYLRLSAGLIGLLVLAGAAAMFVGKDATAQQSFFDPCGSQTIVDDTPNAPSDLTGQLGIGIGADCVPLTGDDTPNYNSGGLIYFTPPEWGVARDADIPDGTKVGFFGSRAVLALLNNSCTTVLSVPFDLLDGTIDHAKPIEASPPGTPNRLNNIAQDGDSNGIPDGAEKWPTYLDAVATRAGIDMSKLIARFVGFNTRAVSGTTVVLNFLIFEPGTKVSNLINLDPRLGYPAVTILQDPSGIASTADPVSDFCAPLYTQTTLNGKAGSANFRTNPPAGTYNFVTYIASATDEDRDGIENGLDPCPTIANTSGWDPRALQAPGAVGDADADGIPVECDPFPDTASNTAPCGGVSGAGIANSDEDCDGWMNRGDNCSIVANTDQADADLDGLGDACDPDSNVRSFQTSRCLISQIAIGGGGTAPDVSNLQPCGNAELPGEVQGSPTPVGQTPTPLPSGVTPRPSGAAGSSGVGGTGPVTGIGTLSPAGVEIPIWAAVFLAVGLVGLLGGFTMVGSHLRRRR